MSILYYILEANIYLAIFYGFYRVMLHQETFYSINRYYLVFSAILAFIIPLIQIGVLRPIDPVAMETHISEFRQIDYGFQASHPMTTTAAHLSIDTVILSVYLFICIIFLLRILWGFRYILKVKSLSTRKIENGIRIIELAQSKSAFSFFNLLFIDPELPQKSTIIKHEMAHIRQRHSIDVLLFELVQMLSWFNPISYLIKNDIRLLHEYLADEETTNQDIQKYDYAMFLIQNSCGSEKIGLANQMFSSSILKKRIYMLNQKKSAKWARLKLLIALPLTGTMLCLSTMAFTKDYGYVDLYSGTNDVLIKKEKGKSQLEMEEGIKIQNTGAIHTMEGTGKNSIQLPASPVKGNSQVVNGVTLTPPPVLPNQEKPVKPVKIPPPVITQIKFPPPVIRPDAQDHFYPRNEYSSATNKLVKVEKRLIVINGSVIEDNRNFHGAKNSKSVKFLAPQQAIKIYGKEKGKNGAVVITGDQIKLLDKVAPPPLPIERAPKQ